MEWTLLSDTCHLHTRSPQYWHPGHQYITPAQNTLQLWALTQTTYSLMISGQSLRRSWLNTTLSLTRHQRLQWRLFEARVNMGPVEPPQQKGRLPQYACHQLLESQQKFDELKELGIFKCPEDINIPVEYLNLSFLMKKPNSGYRLVTAFANVGHYSKPQPSVMPDVDSNLRLIVQWKHVIVTDLTSKFYQIPFSHDSLKYCGVATPFWGVQVYARSAMGMPGSKMALEELMSQVLGDLLKEGIAAKITNDLYWDGNSLGELLLNWKKVLQALHKCDLHLSASIMIVNPQCTMILGWVWNSGTLSASPHHIIALASCPEPDTVT